MRPGRVEEWDGAAVTAATGAPDCVGEGRPWVGYGSEAEGSVQGLLSSRLDRDP